MTDRPATAAPSPADRRPADQLHLSPRHRAQLEALLREHLPDVEVWAYGSRITGESHDGSDLDLVLRAPDLQEIPIGRLSDLWEALRESTIPFLIEARDWARLPEGFHGEIERDYVVLVEGVRADAAGSTADREWVNSTIGEIAEVFGGGTPSTKDLSNFGGNVPWITPKDLSGSPGRYVSRGARNLSKKGLASSAARLLPAGTVLLSTRAPIGYVAIAASPVTTNQGFRNLVLKDGFSPDFYYYWLTNNVPELERHASGSTFKEISGTAVKQIDIPVPPFSEQRAIAHVLGALDDKIELNRRMNETLEAMARALFQSWFVDFDPVRAKMEGRETGLPKEVAELFPDRLIDSRVGAIPEGWLLKPLDSVAHFQNGLALQKYRPGQGNECLPVVKIAQLRTGRTGGREWASAAIKPECVIENGDVIFSWSGSLLVRMWCGGRAALNQHLFKVTSNRYPKWFYLYCILAHFPEFQRIVDDKTTTMGHIRRHHLTDALCVVAPDSLLAVASETFDALLERQVVDEVESRALETLRDALLPRLISGHLRMEECETSRGSML